MDNLDKIALIVGLGLLFHKAIIFLAIIFLNFIKGKLDFPYWTFLVDQQEKTMTMVNLNNENLIVEQAKNSNYKNLVNFLILEFEKFHNKNFDVKVFFKGGLSQADIDQKTQEVYQNLFENNQFENYILFLRKDTSWKAYIKRLILLDTIKKYEVAQKLMLNNKLSFKASIEINEDMEKSVNLCNKIKQLLN